MGSAVDPFVIGLESVADLGKVLLLSYDFMFSGVLFWFPAFGCVNMLVLFGFPCLFWFPAFGCVNMLFVVFRCFVCCLCFLGF